MMEVVFTPFLKLAVHANKIASGPAGPWSIDIQMQRDLVEGLFILGVNTARLCLESPETPEGAPIHFAQTVAGRRTALVQVRCKVS